jgi:type VI secretion system secreted protein VgrG
MEKIPKTTWTPAGSSSTTPTDDKRRKEVPLPAPTCWIEDYEKEISVNSTGRYAEAYNAAGVSHGYSMPRKYKIYVPLKTSLTINVEVRFKIVPRLTVRGTAEEKAAAEKMAISNAKSAFESGIAANWNGKLKLEINDPVCGKKKFDIVYKALWVTSDEHCVLNVHTASRREGVTGTVVDVSAKTRPWVYAHEFGHTVGLPDEYSYEDPVETVKYYKPDGTLDSAIRAPKNGKNASEADATIMSADGSLVVLPRHAWNIAIEVQELLTSKIGRKITCDSV